MKTLGIIGGIAPASTIDYYRTIVALVLERTGAYPPILINSIDLNKLLTLAGEKRFDELTSYLLDEVQKLARAGADFAILASNTPHLVFDELQAVSPLPLLSIVKSACDAAAAYERVGIFGTRFVMESRVYPATFVRPLPEEQEIIHTKYMTELIEGRFLPQTRGQLMSFVTRMQERDGIRALLLAGTELPLLLRDEEWHGVRLLDTGRIHAAAAVTRILEF
jgi:aspartate racemase